MAGKKELGYMKNADDPELREMERLKNNKPGQMEVSYDEDGPYITPLTLSFTMGEYKLEIPLGPEQVNTLVDNLMDYLACVRKCKGEEGI